MKTPSFSDLILIIETRPDGQERVLAPCSHPSPIAYLETDDQVAQEIPQ